MGQPHTSCFRAHGREGQAFYWEARKDKGRKLELPRGLGGGSVAPAVSGSPGAAYHQAHAGLGDVAASGGLRDAGDETPVRPPGY